MTRIKGKKDYPEWLKREALHLYIDEGVPSALINDKLGIQDTYRVGAWVRQYRDEGEMMFFKKRMRCGRKAKEDAPETYIARLEEENEFLKKARTELRQEWLAKRDIGSLKSIEENTK
jgi:transposase-like protein